MSQQSNIDKLLLRARLQIEEGQYQLALVILENMQSDKLEQKDEIAYLMGWCYTLSRRWKDAQDVLTQVVKKSGAEDGGVHEDAIDRERRALCYFTLGKAALQLNRYEDAAHHYAKCLKLLNHPKIKRPLEEVICHYGIGTAHSMRGLLGPAIQWYQEAKNLCLPLENEAELANIYYGLCQAYRLSGQWLDARECGEKALHLYQKKRMHTLEGRMHNELGHIALQLSEYREASDHFTSSLAIASSYDSSTMIMLNNTALALVRLAEQRFEEARHYCELAEKVSEKVDDAGLNGRTYLTFGKVILKEMEEKARKGDIDQSQRRELLEEAVEWFERADKYLSLTQDYAGRAELYGHWGNALEDLGQAEEAILCWKRGYEALSSATGPTWD